MSKELAEAFNNIQAIPVVELEYRLYYDTKGKPLTMSSHSHPDGQYVVITKQHYDSANYNCRVVKGKLLFDLGTQFHVQLKKSNSGVPVVKGYANLVVENNEYTDIEYYDRNN
jgi:hypothetical protein